MPPSWLFSDALVRHQCHGFSAPHVLPAADADAAKGHLIPRVLGGVALVSLLLKLLVEQMLGGLKEKNPID